MSDRYQGQLSPAQERRIRAIEERLRAAEKARAAADGNTTRRIIVSEKDIKTTTEDLQAHRDAVDPHPQYTTDTEATAIADSAVADHAAEADPHPVYLTEAEGNILYGSAGFDDSDLDGGEADQHYVGLLVDGGDVEEALTEGVADGGIASTIHDSGPGGTAYMETGTYDADENGIVDEAEALNDGTKSATAAAVADHLANNANPHGVTAAQAGAEPAFAKNSGFNKNLGTGAGTVSEGNHAHAFPALSDTPAGYAGNAGKVVAVKATEDGLEFITGGGGGSGSGEATQKTATQVAHGLAVQECIRLSGTSFVKANASTEADAEVVGIVTVVTDLDNFTYVMDGYVSGLSGLTAGEVYFLQDDGSLGSAPGTINKPVLVALSATEGIFVNYRGSLAGAGGATDLDGLSDVDTTTNLPTTDDGLVFNSSGLWVPKHVGRHTNHIRRSRFNSSAGWGTSGVTASWAQTDMPDAAEIRRHGRVSSVKINATTAGDRYVEAAIGYRPRVYGGKIYTASCYVKTLGLTGSGTPPEQAQLRLIVWDSGGGLVHDSTPATLGVGQDWTRISGSLLLGAASHNIAMRLMLRNVTGDVYFCGLMLVMGEHDDVDYAPHSEDNDQIWA